MDFEIRFKGLLAFAKLTTPNRLVVAFMAHADHDSVLSVETAKYLKDQSTVSPKTTSGNLSCFDLEGRIITSLGSGHPTTIDINDVPSYNQGFPQATKPEGSAHKGKPSIRRFFAVFELPAVGELKPLGYYIKKGSFNNGTPVCIPKSLIFKATVNDTVTFYVGDLTQTIVVSGNAVVSLTNLDPKVKGGHYHAFKMLFENSSSITTIYSPKETAEACGKSDEPVPNCTTAQDLDVDCSPVRFP
jgi:hypothetical protein